MRCFTQKFLFKEMVLLSFENPGLVGRSLNAPKGPLNLYASDFSNLIFYFMALGTLSSRFIILLAACPQHPSTFWHPGLQNFARTLPFAEQSPKFAYLIPMLPSRPHLAPSSYVIPSSSTWNYILCSYISCAFITELRVGVSISSLADELLEAGLLCPPYNATCFTHEVHASNVFWSAPRAVSQGALVFWEFRQVSLCASVNTQILLSTLLQFLPPPNALGSLEPILVFFSAFVSIFPILPLNIITIWLILNSAGVKGGKWRDGKSSCRAKQFRGWRDASLGIVSGAGLCLPWQWWGLGCATTYCRA